MAEVQVPDVRSRVEEILRESSLAPEAQALWRELLEKEKEEFGLFFVALFGSVDSRDDLSDATNAMKELLALQKRGASREEIQAAKKAYLENMYKKDTAKS